MSRVDVIVPCYNYGHYLRECVESLLSQEGVEVRVLIIDDCSPDNTPQVAAELMSQDSRIEYRRHEKNMGNIATYNEGLNWASAEYTLLISADDLLVPGSLGRSTRLLNAHPEVGMVHGGVLKFDQGKPLPRVTPDLVEYSWEIYEGLHWLEKLCRNRGDGIISPEVVVRTKLQHQLGGYRPNLPHSGDIEMWVRFALSSSIGYILAPQAYLRLHGNNMHLGRDPNLLLLLNDRRAAFRDGFQLHGDGGEKQKRLEQVAYSTLASEALWAATCKFDKAGWKNEEVANLMSFATDTFPDARKMRLYLALRLRLLCGQNLFRFLRWMARRGRIDKLRSTTASQESVHDVS
jgi:glycosyltransferase involved in cell wall biosynthesis